MAFSSGPGLPNLIHLRYSWPVEDHGTLYITHELIYLQLHAWFSTAPRARCIFTTDSREGFLHKAFIFSLGKGMVYIKPLCRVLAKRRSAQCVDERQFKIGRFSSRLRSHSHQHRNTTSTLTVATSLHLYQATNQQPPSRVPGATAPDIRSPTTLTDVPKASNNSTMTASPYSRTPGARIRTGLSDLKEFYSTRMPLPPLSTDQTELVRITASGKGPSLQGPLTFEVRRNLISAASEYLRAVFDFRANNGQKMESELFDVQPWVLSTFLAWLNDGKIQLTSDAPKYWTDETEQGLEERVRAKKYAALLEEEQRILPVHYDILAEDGSQPISWEWTKLFELYLFADAYSSRPFRQAVLEIIQLKYSLEDPTWFPRPQSEELGYVFRNTPQSSMLRRLISDVIASKIVDLDLFSPEESDYKKKVKDLEQMPPELMLQASLSLGKTVAAQRCCADSSRRGFCVADRAAEHQQEQRPALDRDWCFYHEHETDEEKATCLERRECLKGKVRLVKDRVDAVEKYVNALNGARRPASSSLERTSRSLVH